MTRHVGRTFVFALLSLASSATHASAAMLPDAWGSAQVFTLYGGTNQSNSGIPSSAGFVSGSSTAQASVIGSPIPVVSVAVTNNNAFNLPNGGIIGADAHEGYYFTVAGPASALIPLFAEGSLSSSGSPSTFADIGIGRPIDSARQDSSLLHQHAAGADNTLAVSFDKQILVPSNIVLEVELRAGTEAGAGATENASADPYLFIDPSFLAANPGYSLEFSDGIVNEPISETPLPPSFSMFAAALVGLAAFAWRRQKRLS